MGGEDQLVSFFTYSIFVYPVARYLVSPERKYSRWKGALYCILFLAGICAAQMYYEKMEEGPNFFQVLNVGRDSTKAEIKKAFKALSLVMHPDKNKSPTALQDFQRIKHAFDVVVDGEARDIYNRLGLRGLQTFIQHTVTLEYIATNMLVSFASSLVMVFLMTFGEPDGEAFSFCTVGLAVIFLAEYLLVVEKVPLPVWLPGFITVHDVTSGLHRIFPAYMHGCRCILGSFPRNHLPTQTMAFSMLQDMQNKVTVALIKVSKQFRKRFCECSACSDGRVQFQQTTPKVASASSIPCDSKDWGSGSSLFQQAINDVERRGLLDSSGVKAVEDCVEEMQSGAFSKSATTKPPRQPYPLKYLVGFILVSYAWSVFNDSSTSSS